ncbi:rna-directed dna polymerase from mobile element jockey-like [Limosa lapponica baueri]|uniref:Rna-directed dna polymerase from mobile element jockey-like n=1 Tax=Limosa lapponica baueri TaxID=1758121 RepID=A0A2I0T3P1_LIMLA|nr:rna-directed dna polymerase from mobile element jockey-like [Limosa lapponica baueri]
MIKVLKPSQQLVISCIYQGLIPGPIVFNVFFNNLDNGTECTFSRFVDDTKLGRVTDRLESSTAIQRTSTNWRYGLEKWTNAQSRIWDRITMWSRMGWELIGLAMPVQRRSYMQHFGHEPALHLCGNEGQDDIGQYRQE